MKREIAVMEVFSRRFPATGATRTAGKQVDSSPVMAPDAVQALFRHRLSAICARFEDWSDPVCVAGLVGEVPPDHWRRRMATPLLDEKTGTALLLDMSPSLLEGHGLHAGEPVQVTGLLRAHVYQGQVVPRLEVLAIQRDRLVQAARQRDMLVRLLHDVPPQRHDFPAGAETRMLILGLDTGMERLQALQQALGCFWTGRNVTVQALPATDGEALCASLSRMEQDILFLVIAGECVPHCETFAFLQGLLHCPAYRVLAIESPASHEGDSATGPETVMAHMVEQFSTSPMEAARRLRQESGIIRRRQEEECARQEELAALRASLAALTERPAQPVAPRPVLLPMLVGALLGTSVLLACWTILHIL